MGGTNRNTNTKDAAKLAALFMFGLGWGAGRKGKKQRSTKNKAISAAFFMLEMADSEGVCLGRHVDWARV